MTEKALGLYILRAEILKIIILPFLQACFLIWKSTVACADNS